ncbi:MAG: type II toxin-antitoxin system RelE/ParE family toxin [Bacteroidales bacterium]|nr:type II toxin-antitoxin system RelE/ParE family toxin [Candidatus Cacconaster caballi]
MAKYHLTKKAVQDLDAIWAYTLKTWSEKKADEYYSALVETFAAIARRPGNLDKEYVEIHLGLYRRSCLKHLVFYRLVEDGDIEIIRILHERMDIASKFR